MGTRFAVAGKPAVRRKRRTAGAHVPCAPARGRSVAAQRSELRQILNSRSRGAPGHAMRNAPLSRERVLQREAAAPPAFRDCTAAITGRANANEILEAARQRARGFVGAARRALTAAPAAGSTYATAAGRHFVNPTAAQRTTLRGTYGQILRNLSVRNFICNSGRICARREQAFWLPSDDLIHVCPRFWTVNRTCQAIILVHEAAHDAGIDAAAGPHGPNRGSAAYPVGNTPAPAGQTTAGRMNNCDAYAFFGAHLWRGTDTGGSCF